MNNKSQISVYLPEALCKSISEKAEADKRSVSRQAGLYLEEGWKNIVKHNGAKHE